MLLLIRRFLAIAVFLSFVTIAKTQCPEITLSWFSVMSPLPVDIVSNPAVGSNDDGRLELFVIGGDGSLWHSWQLPENVKQWSPWASFGHPPGETFSFSDIRVPVISVTKDRAGRLQVFVVNGKVWQIGQAARNVNWTAWRSLGRPTSPAGEADAVWSIANADGRIELFIRNNASFSLQHMWQLGDAYSWNGAYTEFGWPAGTLHDQLALSIDPTGRIVLATIGDAVAYVRRQRVANADWEGWQALPSPNATVRFNSRFISLARNADGRLELLAEDVNQNLWHTWQATSLNQMAAPWTNSWASYGSPVTPGNFIVDEKFVQGAGGCLTALALCQINGSREFRIGFPNSIHPRPGEAGDFNLLRQQDGKPMVCLRSPKAGEVRSRFSCAMPMPVAVCLLL